MNRFYLKIILTLLLSSFATHLAIAEVKAYLNQSSFFEGDPITLKIESSTNNNAKLDLTPLEKDFTILGTGTNSQISIMNGKRSFKKIWTIELQAKSQVNKGALKIPSITIGNEKTTAVNLTIAELPPEVTAETSKHVFIESSIGTTGGTTFVQQQIPYTVKLFYDSSMQTAEIQTPTLENAIVEQLGEDKRYEVVRAGKRFNVVEKHFVISPEKSGPLRIPPAIVKGRIALANGDSPSLRKRMDKTDMLNNFFNDFRNDPFFSDSFEGFLSNRSQGPSKPFSLSSQEINVKVLPVPDAFTGAAWLPAEDLTIKDSWATKPPNLKVGEPVTRSLTLQAKGLAGSQIPDITFAKPDKLKSYPEKAKSETRTDGDTVYGIKHTDISYIPSVSGKVTIPRIMVDWWDVKSNKQRTFTLPEWNLNVAPGLNNSADKNILKTPETDQIPAVQNTTTESKDNNLDSISDVPANYWGWKLIIALPIFLLLISMLIYRLKINPKKHQDVTQASTSKNKKQTVSALRSSLLQACQNNDKQLAATKLIALAQAEWQDDSIQNLGSLASKLAQGSNVIEKLEQSLYGVDTQQWDGRALTKLIEDGLQQKQNTSHKPSDGLKPLYPA
jgi:hypothetical protein